LFSTYIKDFERLEWRTKSGELNIGFPIPKINMGDLAMRRVFRMT
jgi:hypothetical protein